MSSLEAHTEFSNVTILKQDIMWHDVRNLWPLIGCIWVWFIENIISTSPIYILLFQISRRIISKAEKNLLSIDPFHQRPAHQQNVRNPSWGVSSLNLKFLALPVYEESRYLENFMYVYFTKLNSDFGHHIRWSNLEYLLNSK